MSLLRIQKTKNKENREYMLQYLKKQSGLIFHHSIQKIIITICMVLAVFPVQGSVTEKGHHIEFFIEGVEDSVTYLIHYYGNSNLVAATSTSDKPGHYQFSGTKPLPAGFYLLVAETKSSSYLELIIDDDQHFIVKATKEDIFGSITFEGSAQNSLFHQYTTFINNNRKRIEALQQEFNTLKNDSITQNIQKENRKKEITTAIENINKEVKDYQRDIVKKHPHYLLSLLIKLSWEPEVPIKLTNESTRADSVAAFRYYKNHFWSDIDLSDARVVRTPVFHNKLKKYLTEVILQHPDTFVYEAEYLIARTKNDSDMFKYIVWFSVYAAESSKIVGMDKAFVYLAKSYYLAGRCWWASNAVLKTMNERVEKLERILIGMVAPELRMWDTNKNIVSMHAVEATYLILAFWEYDCGHCKKTLPVLRDYYHMYKDKGVKVFSVCTKKDMDRWKSYINENNLDFINVNGAYHLQFGSQTDNNPYFYDLPYNEVYDIIATPVYFLLDKDKKIIAKRIEPQQMFEIIDRELKQQKKEPQ